MHPFLLTFLNARGQHAVQTALHLSLQFAILTAVLGLVDLALRNRVRAALRYGLWMLVVLRLLLPPGLLSPTSAAYWIGSRFTPTRIEPPPGEWTVTFPDSIPTARTPNAPIHFTAAASPPFTGPAALLLGWVAGSIALAGWMARGQRRVNALVRKAGSAPPALQVLLRSVAQELSLSRVPELRVSAIPHSPAVCGLWRPVILLPASLDLSDAAWRTVLRHELIHLRRYDLWANALQVLTQLVWWWNPLVWWANARIRQLRETAVDEAVMLATNPEVEDYPSTLVTMARHCLVQPGLTLNFLGILESPSRLERRVRRLVEQPLPRTAQLGWGGWAIVLSAAAGVVPMGFESQPAVAPAPAPATAAVAASTTENPLATAPARIGAVPIGSAAATPSPSSEGSLVTRTYRLASEVMVSLLNEPAAEPIPVGADVVQTQLRRFMARQGLNFPAVVLGQAPPENSSATFLNTNTGVLFVRASMKDQGRLERVIQWLNQKPQQISLETHIVEADLGTIARLELVWETSVADNPGTNTAPIARLTADQSATLLARLKATPGIDILSSPKVTTLSERRAQVTVGEMRTLVTGLSNSPTGPVTLTTQLQTGSSVDLTAICTPFQPTLLQLEATGQVVEFLGYEEAKTPKPLIRTNSAHGTGHLRDGQTLILQLPPVTNVVKMIDRMVYLSDIPLIGELFTKRSTGTVVRQRLVLITPMLIDPAGQRIHDPEHQLFDPTKLP